MGAGLLGELRRVNADLTRALADVLEGRRAVDVRLALAEEIEVRAVEDRDDGEGAHRTDDTDGRLVGDRSSPFNGSSPLVHPGEATRHT